MIWRGKEARRQRFCSSSSWNWWYLALLVISCSLWWYLVVICCIFLRLLMSKFIYWWSLSHDLSPLCCGVSSFARCLINFTTSERSNAWHFPKPLQTTFWETTWTNLAGGFKHLFFVWWFSKNHDPIWLTEITIGGYFLPYLLQKSWSNLTHVNIFSCGGGGSQPPSHPISTRTGRVSFCFPPPRVVVNLWQPEATSLVLRNLRTRRFGISKLDDYLPWN